MTGGSQRAALDAVHSARPIVARLSATRDKEDLAADIIEAWGAVETGLRSLIGGSALAGQMLIRELRQRHFLTLEQANSLAEFHAARERAGRTDYTPTDADVNSVRDAFLKLEAGLMGDDSARAAPTAAMHAAAAHAPVDEPASARTVTSVPTPTSRPAWMIPVLGIVGLVVVVALIWLALAGRGGSAAMDQGITAYREGRREAAEGSFRKAATDNATDPMPHVYLARMAREAGRLQTAQEEAVKGVSLGPSNAIALRELASVSFAQQNYDAARRFYLRALSIDATDALSQGYLGCSLIRLGRVAEGVKFIQRAGSGSWTGCLPGQSAAPGTPGMMPPGTQQYPPGYQPAPLSP